MKIHEVISLLESWAPRSYQESYDNSGLIIGDKDAGVSKALLTLDCTESVVEEAMQIGANLIVAHHPILFSGIKSLTGKNYVERTILKAIKNDIAIYAIHTNLDNILTGVNKILADKLGLIDQRILSPKGQLLKKLIVFIPIQSVEEVKEAIFSAGAGRIGNYSECGYTQVGQGSFRGNEKANPTIGSKHVREIVDEIRFETVFLAYMESNIISAMKKAHPYEEVAYDIYSIENEHSEVGSGLIGELKQAIPFPEFLKSVKSSLNLEIIKYAGVKDVIKKVAICGGSGSFLRADAVRADADIFITSDMKYHEWFDSEDKLVIADVGHFESEQFVPQLIFEFLQKKALSLQAEISRVQTNPVKIYL